ncbi:Sphingomyelin phosphodiesterase [Entamoeba marina]
MLQRPITISFAGDQTSGKTAFIKTLLQQPHDPFHKSTLDETYNYDISVNDKQYKITMLDCSGSQEFRAMLEYDVKMSDGVLLFFDMTCNPTFVNLEEYFECFNNACYEFDLPLILIGNIRDDEDDETKQEDVDKFCKKHNCSFYRMNCIKDQSIAIEVLSQLVKLIKKL